MDPAQPAASDHVAVIRRAFDAWNARDAEALAECFTEDAEVHSAVARVDGGEGVYRGRAGVRDWLSNNVETVAFTVQPTQYFTYRSRTLALVTAHMHAASSGVSLPQEYGMVYEIRDGLIARMLTYLDPAEAIEEMGRLARR